MHIEAAFDAAKCHRRFVLVWVKPCGATSLHCNTHTVTEQRRKESRLSASNSGRFNRCFKELAEQDAQQTIKQGSSSFPRIMNKLEET